MVALMKSIPHVLLNLQAPRCWFGNKIDISAAFICFLFSTQSSMIGNIMFVDLPCKANLAACHKLLEILVNLEILFHNRAGGINKDMLYNRLVIKIGDHHSLAIWATYWPDIEMSSWFAMSSLTSVFHFRNVAGTAFIGRIETCHWRHRFRIWCVFACINVGENACNTLPLDCMSIYCLEGV